MTPPNPPLTETLQLLYQHSQCCLAAIEQADWPTALKAMADRQPCLDALEAACPLPDTVKQNPLFTQWLDTEHHLQTAMQQLNAKQVQLEQVFAQIQSARQQLTAYQVQPALAPNDAYTQSIDG